MSASPQLVLKSDQLRGLSLEEPPKPDQVEDWVELYQSFDRRVQSVRRELEEKQKLLDMMKDDLREIVSKYGSAHAEKSKLLHGITHEIMCTYGSSTSIDAGAVERFRAALAESKQTRLLKKLFERTVRWTLAPTYAVVIKGEKLSHKLTALWAQCEVVKAKTPTLVVREKNA